MKCVVKTGSGESTMWLTVDGLSGERKNVIRFTNAWRANWVAERLIVAHKFRVVRLVAKPKPVEPECAVCGLPTVDKFSYRRCAGAPWVHAACMANPPSPVAATEPMKRVRVARRRPLRHGGREVSGYCNGCGNVVCMCDEMAGCESVDATIERLTRERDEATTALAVAEMHVSMLEALKPQEQWDARRAAEAQRDEALALLRECEWAAGPCHGGVCAICGEDEPYREVVHNTGVTPTGGGHDPDCRLSKVLRGGA